ncbi:MAG TPA: glycosyltransferase [Cytophagaceae bacterium]|nr:glycosyltransferase [Cytophagaceae bacterium]
MKILFIVPYPVGIAPSQRFRFEQYLGILKKTGISFDISPFFDEGSFQILYKKGLHIRKLWGVAKSFIKRWFLLFSIHRYQFIFIHREASPLGPAFFEWIIAWVLRKKIIYDFDDAIWLPNTSNENRIVSHLKWHRKVSSICRWAYNISCGNQYLCEYASRFNKHTILNPTTIDSEHLHNKIKDQHSEKVVIGWTGTHSTIRYLYLLLPVLKRLETKYDFTFLVIADKDPELPLKSYQYLNWNIDSEVDDLLKMNIGVMPLEEDPWSQGKCGFKALQYMALGIPALVSPVGVNSIIVDNGLNGFICKDEQDWYEKLELLLKNEPERTLLGKAAREKVIQKFSVNANTENFLSLFETK